MAMCLDPFDSPPTALVTAPVRREAPSLSAHLPPFALVIPTLFGPATVARPEREEDGDR